MRRGLCILYISFGVCRPKPFWYNVVLRVIDFVTISRSCAIFEPNKTLKERASQTIIFPRLDGLPWAENPNETDDYSSSDGELLPSAASEAPSGLFARPVAAFKPFVAGRKH